MPQVIIQSSVAPTEYPPGTSLGQYRFRLSKGGLPAYTQYIDPPLPAQVVFDGVAVGEYTLTVLRLSIGGLSVGTAYTHPTPIVVAAPPPVVGDGVVGAAITVA